MLTELLSYDFIVRALVAGSLTAVTAAIVGNFIVAARLAVLSDMLAHAALAGVGVGMFLHIAPGLLAGVSAVAASLFLWALARRGQRAPEAVSMLLLTGSLAIALLFAHAAKDNPLSFDAFLFGSILTITAHELVYFSATCLGIIAVFVLLWHSFLGIVFDPQFARVQSRYTAAHEVLLLLSVGALVAVALKVIGGLLVGALLVIPALTAHTFTRSFRANVLWSTVFGIIGTVSGISTSFYLDIPTSSGIVLSLVGLFVLFAVLQKVRR